MATLPADVPGPPAPPGDQRIHLRILSPAPASGVPETVDIRDVPLTTTIEALKQRIFMVAPSHPPPQTQRLIFAGRLWSNELASLADALGAEAIRNNDLLTVHMIIRDHQSTDGSNRPATRSGTPAGTRMSRESSSRGQEGRPSSQNATQGQQPQAFQQPQIAQFPRLAPFPGFPPPMGMQPNGAPGNLPIPQPQPGQPGMTPAMQQQVMQQQQQALQQHVAMHQAAVRQAALAQQQPPRVVVNGTLHQWGFVPAPHAGNQQPAQDGAAQPTGHPTNTQPQSQHRPAGAPPAMPLPSFHAPGFRFGAAPQAPLLASTALAQSLANLRAREQLLHAPASMYLVSSPRGPQAVVYHESGTFQAHMSGLGTPVAPLPTRTWATQEAQQNGHGRQAGAAPAQNQQQGPLVQVQENARAGAPAHANNGAAPGDAAEAVQANAIINHVWTLFRILITTYFLIGSGDGWRRPLIMLLVVVGFMIFRTLDAGRGMRDAVRAWWNGIVGLPNRAANQPDGAGQQRPAGAAAGQTGGGNAPAIAGQPQQDNDMGALRRRLRPVEQAAALFVASLWPGVGENTIRQRHEAEAQQRREEAEAAAAAAIAEQERAAAAAEAQQTIDKAAVSVEGEKQNSADSGEGSSSGAAQDANDGVRERRAYLADGVASSQTEQ